MIMVHFFFNMGVDSGYFLIQIAEAIMMQVFSTTEPDHQVLVNSLMQVRPVMDMDLVEKVKNDNVDEEED